MDLLIKKRRSGLSPYRRFLDCETPKGQTLIFCSLPFDPSVHSSYGLATYAKVQGPLLLKSLRHRSNPLSLDP